MEISEIEKEYIEEFLAIKSDLEQWGEIVDASLIEMLKDFSIKIPIKHRIKDLSSYITKAIRKPYKEPILETEDKVGTRIVVLLTDEVDRIGDIIKNSTNWIAKETKSKIEYRIKNPEVFGYQSIHYVVEPKVDDKRFRNEIKNQLTCEIQIRTLLQHAYAEMSHDNVYKGPFYNDKSVLRDLAKSMALMESADDYFCKIYNNIIESKNMDAQMFQYLEAKILGLKGLVKNVDREFNADIITLASIKKVEISQIDNWLKENPGIETQIRINESHLFYQPAIILLCYLIVNYPRYVISNLEMNKEIISNIYTAMNMSYDKYL